MSHLEYDPLRWPPEMALAQLHFDCTKPGIDNPEGARCPCCQRSEKLDNSKWPARDITKDFKNYGGGVPGYFYLLWYFVAMMVILIGLKAVYHIMLIEGVCKYIEKTYVEQGEPATIQCSNFLGVKFLDPDILYQQLDKMGKGGDADVLQYLQLATYVVLVLGTVGMKIFFQLINKDRISLDEKLFSRFSLVIKNVPLYYQLEDLKEELRAIDPKLEFQEMFYLHKASQYSTSYRKLFDLYFELKNLEQGITQDDREKQVTELRKKYEEYLALYDQTMILGEGLNKNSKKILVVFNTIDQKEKVHAKLKMNEGLKFLHYMSKILGIKSSPIGYYSERLAQPQEIYWNNIGQSSTHKQKVRLETTFLGVGFMILSFVILYFPMYKIDEEKAEKPGVGTALGILIGIVIIIVAIIYRTVIVRLMPTRRPSSKLAELLFMCMTITVFQYFYFMVTPATFYLLATSIPNNMKLKEFFSAILTFCLVQLLIALLDPMYRGNKKKRERLLSQASEANVYCQQRLHEEITPPSFPIDLKLMLSFTIWNFSSYYTFEIPYIPFIFLITVILLYWIDKYNLYRHYKMQQYMSIELEIKMQKTNIILFLIGASFGYYMSSQEWWEYIAVIVVVVLGLALNFGLNYTYKKQKDSILKHNTDLKSALQNCKSSFGQNMHLQMLEKEIKSSFLVAPAVEEVDLSSVSLASELVSYGYLDTYTLFLNQFKNKRLNSLLEEKCYSIRHSKTILDGRKRQESELVRLGDDGLHQPLLGKDPEEKKEETVEVEYVPPPIVTVTEAVKVEEPLRSEEILKVDQPVRDGDGERSEKSRDEE